MSLTQGGTDDREPHPIMWTLRPNADRFSTKIDNCCVAVEIDGYLTDVSPLRARRIVPGGEALVVS